jgi:hypothetical protein
MGITDQLASGLGDPARPIPYSVNAPADAGAGFQHDDLELTRAPVSIPRQSRGLLFWSRSKRLIRVAPVRRPSTLRNASPSAEPPQLGKLRYLLFATFTWCALNPSMNEGPFCVLGGSRFRASSMSPSEFSAKLCASVHITPWYPRKHGAMV